MHKRNKQVPYINFWSSLLNNSFCTFQDTTIYIYILKIVLFMILVFVKVWENYYNTWYNNGFETFSNKNKILDPRPDHYLYV